MEFGGHPRQVLGRVSLRRSDRLKCRIFFTKKNSNDMFKPTVMGIVLEYYSRKMIYYNIRYNKHVYHDNYN